ncbi:ABC transporter permease [Streptomyces spongiicola]|uniref:Xylose transport system permease protein XylH n=1 Tax=Streptomyces spongiicola TaxID=1690221 RepID=A0A2S1YVF6_9ACTN|nr:ABC transporter permease [Streptomyces spongiicola]AWK07718.1 ABC transporter permease [Streptomyces spongiicola]GBQ02415.1 ABC transporter permease [Streptomyces spongiicola]
MRRTRAAGGAGDTRGGEGRPGSGPAPGDQRRADTGGGLRGHARGFAGRMRGGEFTPLPGAIGVALLWIVFQSLDQQFLSPRNLSNLSIDIVGTGMIALGLVFVLLLGDVDLSVGSVSGLTAAVFAVLNVNQGMPEWLAVLAALVVGAAIGATQGFCAARLGVPAFVVTLAGLLAWNGLMLYVLGVSGTVNLPEEGFVNALTSYYFRDVAVAYGLAALSVAGFLVASYRNSRRRRAVGVAYRPLRVIAGRTAAVAVVAFAAAWILNRFQGLPLALLVFLVFVLGLDFVLRRTYYGRRIVSVGGGTEAARRAGINVVWLRISAFMVSGTLAAVGGLFLASRVAAVGQTSGSSILLINAIAAAVIGGVSLFGGRGSTWSVLLGMLVIQSIASGMVLLGIPTPMQSVITGGVLLAAVVLDSLSRRSQRAHGRV